MNGDVTLLLVSAELSYGVHTSGHSRALRATYDHGECDLRLGAKLRAGLLQSTAALAVMLL